MAYTQKSDRQTKNIHILGLVGEKIFANAMQDMGYKVHFNADPFGFNDHRVFFDKATPTITQLKTISAYNSYDCWAIDADAGKQVEHALKCEKMYIISIPLVWANEYDGWLLEVDLNILKTEPNSIRPLPNSTQNYLVIPRSERYVRKVYKLTQAEEDILLKYAVSNYAKKPSTYVKKKATKKSTK